MGKVKTFYTGQNTWKIHANQNENQKKLQKIQPFTVLYTIFHEKCTLGLSYTFYQ